MDSETNEPEIVPQDDGGSPPPRAKRASHDTTAGCRDRAEADLQSSLEMNTVNGRLGMEQSAASWTARADLLQRLDDLSQARHADAPAAPAAPSAGDSAEA